MTQQQQQRTPAPTGQAAPPTGVVVGVDGSASARAAVAWAAAAAGRRGATLHLVEVLPPGADPTIEGTDQPGTPHGRARAQLTRARQIARTTSPGLDVTMHTRTGRVGPALVDHAAEASMLVVGSNGPGGPIPLSLGSILGDVTRHCACPVVLVPAAVRASAAPTAGPVLVALEDGPDGDRALVFAADVAERREVGLTVLVSGPNDANAVAPGQLAEVRRLYPDLPLELRTIEASPADALLAADADAALLVVTPQGRRRTREHPIGGWTAHFLPILSTCPVAVVSSHTRGSAALA